MKMYIVCAQMGDENDWSWEEVERTADEQRAIEMAKQGCRIYEEPVADENQTIDACLGISVVLVEDQKSDLNNLPF